MWSRQQPLQTQRYLITIENSKAYYQKKILLKSSICQELQTSSRSQRVNSYIAILTSWNSIGKRKERTFEPMNCDSTPSFLLFRDLSPSTYRHLLEHLLLPFITQWMQYFWTLGNLQTYLLLSELGNWKSGNTVFGNPFCCKKAGKKLLLNSPWRKAYGNETVGKEKRKKKG